MLKFGIFRISLGWIAAVLALTLFWNTIAWANASNPLWTIQDEDLIYEKSSDDRAPVLAGADSSCYSLAPPTQEASLRAWHKYLGYATAILAVVTAATSSAEEFHEIAGYTTAGFSLVTTGTGFIEYGEYFDLSEGLSAYNVHMVLGTLATIGFGVAAGLAAGDSGHAAIGGVSTGLMILPIIVIKW